MRRCAMSGSAAVGMVEYVAEGDRVPNGRLENDGVENISTLRISA
jgi:hypothetical protein